MGYRDIVRAAKREKWAYIMLAPVIVYFAVVYVVPVVRTVALGFSDYTARTGAVWVGLKHYRAILHDRVFWRAGENTLIYTVGVVAISVWLSLFLANLIFQLPRAAQSGFKAAYYLPSVVSMVSVSLVWLWLYQPSFGFLNQLLRGIGVPPVLWLASPRTALGSIIAMIVLTGQGVNIILFNAAMGNIPVELYESADMDGAGRSRKFWGITLPMLRPTVLFVTVTGVITSFQVFTSIYVMTKGGPNYATVTVVYRIYETAFQRYSYGSACAQSTVLFCVMFLVSILQYRVMSERT